MIDRKTLDKLKTFGFKWFKDGTTDAVGFKEIQDIVPAADGFTVIYKNQPEIALIASTAVVTKIDIPESPTTHWIYVHWDEIKDERKPGRNQTQVVPR